MSILETIFGYATLKGEADRLAQAAFDLHKDWREMEYAAVTVSLDAPPAPIPFPPDRDSPETVARRMTHVPGFKVAPVYARSELTIPPRPLQNMWTSAPKLKPHLLMLHIRDSTPPRPKL